MQRVLLVKGIAGIGDRLRVLLCGVLYAKLSGRSVQVDWRDEFYANKAGANIFDWIFELRQEAVHDDVELSNGITPSSWQGALGLSLPELLRRDGVLNRWNREEFIRRYSVDISVLDHAEATAVFCLENRVNLLRSYFSQRMPELEDLDSEKILSCTMSKHVHFRPDVLGAIDEFARKRFNKRMIGVHVRSTTECSLRRYETAIYWKRIRAIRQIEPESRLFVATDNREVLNHFLHNEAATVFYEKWFAAPGDPLHMNNTLCPDPVQSVKDAAVELGLLARCDYLIIPGNSGFSDAACLFSKAAPENRILLNRTSRGVSLLAQRILTLWNGTVLRSLKRKSRSRKHEGDVKFI